jgi:hypothetical protein
MLFDFKTRKWTEVARIGVDYPEWSRDGNYIYFLGVGQFPGVGQTKGVFRVRVSDGHLEELVNLKDFHLAPAGETGMGWLPTIRRCCFVTPASRTSTHSIGRRHRPCFVFGS